MISYLIYSTVCMGVLLLFYQAVLEKEKMHHINRGYLVISLIFSLTIPFIPVGMADAMIPWFYNLQAPEIQPFPYSSSFEGDLTEFGSEGIMPVTEPETSSFSLFIQIALVVYITVATILFVRLLRIIDLIQMKADRNPRKLFENYEIVLLKEKVVSHTFINTIFVNKQQYENGEIGREIMIHELTHARQKHTLDILFVELLKIIFWFNPILYFYKKAILLNHEFLADQAVISNGTPVSDYQTILLNTLLVQPVNGLSSNFNYALTKKRLHMMTQNTPKLRSFLKIIALFPLFVTLSLLLGCESIPPGYTEDEDVSKNLTIEFSDSGMIKVNNEVIHISEFEGYLSELPENPEMVHIYAHPNALMGVVTDVQKMIRDHGVYRINYSSIEEASKSVSNAPPAPPIPPLESVLEESLKKVYMKLSAYVQQAESDPPSPPVLNRNILEILASAQGLLLVNKEPANMNEIKGRVKRFVDNKNADPDLSESPWEAIVTIKTDKQTPYDIYTEMLDAVLTAYNELRDQAARDRFGVSFSSLKQNTEQRMEIVEMYPKKISIREPQER